MSGWSKRTVESVGVVAGLLLPSAIAAQTLFVCESDGRSFVFSGGAAAPGCRAVADPPEDLHLSPAQPDLNDVMRRLAAQSARIERLEQMLLNTRTRTGPLARPPLPRPSIDGYDSQGRLRDLGQDLDRRLDRSGR